MSWRCKPISAARAAMPGRANEPTVGAWAVMAGLLVQCSGGDHLNESETAPVIVLEKPGGEAGPPKPGTQLCDEPGRPAAELEGARLFLSESLPHVYRLGDDARSRLRSRYARDDVEAALKMHRDYDSVAEPALRQWLDRDAAGLRASFRLALPMAEQIYGTRLEPAPPERRGAPSGYEIEFESRYLPLQLAYLILALDQDYSAFETRIELISAARWSPDLQSSDFRRTEAAHRPPHFAVRNEDSVRALAMHRLLKGQESEAEKAMLFVLETRLVEYRRHRFTPYEAGELLVAARASDASFRKFAA